jgi:hypothetical protein
MELQDAPTLIHQEPVPSHSTLTPSHFGLVATTLPHLKEPQAHVCLDDGANNDKIDGWYLDTDANHHMTYRVELFIELNSDIRISVKCGDTSSVEINDAISILFIGKTGVHRLLTSVYYISTLRNSVISLGQLDEGSSCMEIKDGLLRICDHLQRLLVKVN